MGASGWIALLVLAATAVLFYKKWLPLEVTALSLPVVLLATGVLDDPADALAGFGNPAVIAIAAIFVVGAGLREAGVTTIVARLLQRSARHGETALMLAVMTAVAATSAFMSNAAVVAVFIPAVTVVCRRTGVTPSRLLMPVAFAAVLGGNLTALGSAPNLIVDQLLAERTGGHLGILQFGKVGLPVTIAGIAFVALVASRLLPKRTTEQRLRDALLPEDVAESYGLAKSLFRMRVVPESKVCGRTVAEAGLRSRYGLQVIAVMRTRRMRRHFIDPRPDLVLASGDELYLEGEDESAWRFADYEVVQFGLAGAAEIEGILGRGMALAEVALSPHAPVFGRTIHDLAFRSRFGLHALAIWRGGRALRQGLADVPLELGDALLVSGAPDRVRALAEDPDYIVLTDQSMSEDVTRAPLAVLLLLLAIVPPLVGAAPLAVSALAAAVLMVATGCVPLRRAQQAIDWRVLFLIMGTVPLGRALEVTGVARAVADPVLAASDTLGPVAIVAALFVVAAVLSNTTSNAAAAVILGPIALAMASPEGVGAHQALLAVAAGCSCAFVMPHHQWNVLVMGPGGYEPRDYLRLGGGLTAVVAVVAVSVLAVWSFVD